MTEIEWKQEKWTEIIEPTREAVEKYGFGYGAEFLQFSKEDVQALLDGKIVVWNDGEYSHFVRLRK